MNRRRQTRRAFSLFAFQDIITSVTAVVILVALLLAVELIFRQASAAPTESINYQALQQTVVDMEADVLVLRDRTGTPVQRIDKQIQRRTDIAATLAGTSVAELSQDIRDLQQQVAVAEQELMLFRDKQRRSNEQLRKQQANAKDRQDMRGKLVSLQRNLEEIQQQVKELESGDVLVFNPSEATSRQTWLVDVSDSRLVAISTSLNSRITFSQPFESSRVRAFCSWARDRNVQSGFLLLLIRPDGVQVFHELRDALREEGFRIGYDLIGADQEIQVSRG